MDDKWILKDAKELMLKFNVSDFNEYLKELSNATMQLVKVIDKAAINWNNIPENYYKVLFLKNNSFAEQFNKDIKPLINKIDKQLDKSLNQPSLWFYSNYYYGAISSHILILMLHKDTYYKTDMQRLLVDLVYIMCYKVFIGKFKANLVNKYNVNPVVITQAIKTNVRASHKFAQYNTLQEVIYTIATNMTFSFIENFKKTEDLKKIHNFFSQIQSRFQSYANEIRTYYIEYNRSMAVTASEITNQTNLNIEALKQKISFFKMDNIDENLIDITLSAINNAISKDLLIECLNIMKKLKLFELVEYFKQLYSFIDLNLDLNGNIKLLQQKKNKLPIVKEVQDYLLQKNYKLQTISNTKYAIAIYVTGFLLHEANRSEEVFNDSEDFF